MNEATWLSNTHANGNVGTGGNGSDELGSLSVLTAGHVRTSEAFDGAFIVDAANRAVGVGFAGDTTLEGSTVCDDSRNVSVGRHERDEVGDVEEEESWDHDCCACEVDRSVTLS